MEIRILENYTGMSAAAADSIIETVKKKPDALLCFATGSTPVGTYKALMEKTAEQNIDLHKCFCIGLDEWIGVPREKPGTCHYILYEQLFKPLGISPGQVHLFDGMNPDIDGECNKMNELIEGKGGVDAMLVGIGVNGHIGFNEPGVDTSLKAHDQSLHGSTLASGQHYFNEPTAISRGITLGMAQVMGAKKLILIANGKNKAAIMKQALQGPVTNAVPASYVQQCENAIILMDREAATEL